jgi:cellulose synthase/poly-beta-1,6-N-acetylglucosamine synthase-like glycosyltransferase
LKAERLPTARRAVKSPPFVTPPPLIRSKIRRRSSFGGAHRVEHSQIPAAAYMALWGVFALLGVRRLWLLWLYQRARRRRIVPGEPADTPFVTVQLPVYNERYVIRRLIRAVAALDWPRDRLEIQVLDDSTDETTELAAEEVRRLRGEGLDIHHVRRPDRRGYKAGALAWGTARAKGELLLLFDADFVPPPGLLRSIAPHFEDPRVGMVQVRWDHLNADYSLLSRVQAVALDGHFVVEHEARSKHGLFFNFNGTAGVWRKECVADAGGWQHDTLTEDLDLSYRAQLRGWKFVYLRDVTCPSELPVDMRAFKEQQFRWMKGSAQVARKILPEVWRSSLPLSRKLELTVHLTQNLSFPLVLALSLCAYPALTMSTTGWMASAWLQVPLVLLATVSILVFYGAAIVGAQRGLRRHFWTLTAVMSVSIGLSVSNSQAILEGLFGRQTPFHRTPKLDVAGSRAAVRGRERAKGGYRGRASWTTVAELALAAWFAGVLVFSVGERFVWGTPFIFLFFSGYLYVGWLSAGMPAPRRPE